MLNKYVFCCTLFFFLTYSGRAQSKLARSKQRSHYTYIFQVNTQEARQINAKGPFVVNQTFFHTLIDSFAVNTNYNKILPQGHYLFVHSNGPDLDYKLQTYSALSTKILVAKPGLDILVHDTLGNLVTDAQVQLRNKKARFEPLTQTYRFNKAPKKGLLAVQHKNFTLFEYLETEDNYTAQTSFIKKMVWLPPVSYIWRPFYDSYRTIKWHHPQGYIRSLFSLFSSQYRKNRMHLYPSFLVTNKPKYQPGDTVKYKALILKNNGKPVRGNALLQLNNYGKLKNIDTVQPFRSGAYAGYFVLNDSLKLQLDRTYTLSLRKPGKRSHTYVNGTFSFEDYELKENDYSLTLKQKEHVWGQENSLMVRGTNASGLNLLNARVEVAVITRKVGLSTEPVLFVPDTLWVHQQPLDAVGATTINIPASVFPKASLDYTVKATFLDASNERSTQSINGSYIYQESHLKLTLLQDSLWVQYLENGQEKPKLAKLTAFTPDYDDFGSLKLALPARVPLNPYAAGYDVTAGDLTADLDLSEKEALISLDAARTPDSVTFALQNPRRLLYWYYVYRGEKLVASGSGRESYFTLQKPATTEQPYFVNVQYLWAGEVHQLNQDVPLRKHLLTINLEAPAVIYPGQTANLKVAVKNAAGKPVPNVDLTAYAITSKFKNQVIPSIPGWDKYKKQKPYRKLLKEDNSLSGKTSLDGAYWPRRMGLDSITFYNFLYPSGGTFKEYSLTQNKITQVSPFVVKAGKVVPVHVVYLDEVPVYVSWTDVLPAYAFAADSGFHTIKLRTADKLITLDSLYLQHQHKLIISVDITDQNNLLAKAAEKGRLSPYEQNTISRYLLQVEQNTNDAPAYLQQGNRIQLLQKNRPERLSYYTPKHTQIITAGPFSPDWLQYVRFNSFTTNFRLEPGYLYSFAPDLLKMKEWKLPAKPITLSLYKHWGPQAALLQQEVLTDQKIQKDWEAAQYKQWLARLYAVNNIPSHPQSTGKVGWRLTPAVKEPVNLVLLQPADYPDSLLIYAPESTVLYNLQPANYILTLSFKNGSFATKPVRVKANNQTQVFFNMPDVAAPTSPNKYLLQVINKKIAQLKKADKDKVQKQQQQLQTAREIPFIFTDGSELYNHLVTGVVTDAAGGEALPGVTVQVKGTKIGTHTDSGGGFKLYVPSEGVLEVSFIGYINTEVNINKRDFVTIKLAPDAKMLQEVVVGYGVQKKMSLTASTSTVLQGRVAGVNIRGLNSVKAEDARPLVIVDGMLYSGELSALAGILSTKTLKGAAATALYGAAGAAGVIIITTKNGKSLASESLFASANTIRNNFSDYAFWQPRLLTDHKGEASFKATFPDDITQWNTSVIAVDYKKNSGFFNTQIKAFKAVMATLHLPRFLVEGDQTQVVGQALNYLTDSTTVTTKFELAGKPLKVRNKALQRSFTDTLQITAPTAAATDSLAVLFSLKQQNGMEDGERRYVQIYPKGVEENIGQFLALTSDTTFTLHFDPTKGPVRLQTQSDLLQVMLDEINYLHQYPYWCTEQAASKLKGLLLEKQIRVKLGQPFAHDLLIKKLIHHLEKAQLKEGAWTWWQNGPAYTWISGHVTEALVMARNARYPVQHQEQKLIDYLVYVLEKGNYYDKLTALETLYLLQAKVDYNRYLSNLEKKVKLNLEEQLRITRMRQQLKLPVQLDTIQKYQQQTTLGGIYLGKEKNSLFNNHISNTLLAYQILKTAGNQEKNLNRIRTYLLSERRAGHWRNTYESARILEVLLPDLLENATDRTGLPENNLHFAGPLNFTAKEYRIDTTFAGTTPLLVKKSGKFPVYLTAYQTTWNPTPLAVKKDFVVSSAFTGLGKNAIFKAGTPVEMVVAVEVKADAEYVMITVPIPASCSYEAKAGSEAYEVHREYYKNKVNIFCDQLPKGKYTYKVKLLPRYSGSYTLNPAKAELMYFPTFFGRTDIKQVLVK